MKKIFLLVFLTVTLTAQAQTNQAKFGYCVLNNDSVKYFYYRTPVADTTITGLPFKKIQLAQFVNLDGPQKVSYEYEHRSAKKYVLYNQQLQLVHSIVLTAGKTAQGTIYGKQGEVASGFRSQIGTNGYGGMRLSMYATYAHFYLNDSIGNGLYFNRGDYSLAATRQTIDSNTYTHITVNDLKLAQDLKNKAEVTVDYKLQKGNQVQIKYSFGNPLMAIELGKGFNEDNLAVTYTCVADTTIEGERKYGIKAEASIDDLFIKESGDEITIFENDTAYFISQGYKGDDIVKKGKQVTRLVIAPKKAVEPEDVEDGPSYSYKKYYGDYGSDSKPLFAGQYITYDTLAGQLLPKLVDFSGRSNGRIKKSVTPLFFPYRNAFDKGQDEDDGDFGSLTNPLITGKAIYLNIAGKELGKKINTDSVFVHPLVRKLKSNSNGFDYYDNDIEAMKYDSIAMADSIAAAMAAVYSLSNYNDQSFGTVNILSAKKMQVAVFSKSAAEIVIDLVEYDEDKDNVSPSAKTKKYTVAEGWNMFELSGFKMDKWKTYKITIYQQTYDGFSAGDERSFVYAEEGVLLNELTPVYNYKYDYGDY